MKIKDIEMLCSEYLKEDASMSKLAKQYNCKKITIKRNLNKSQNIKVLEKIKNNTTIKMNINLIELCNKYLKENITLEKLANEYRCSIKTIWKYLSNCNDENVHKKLKINNFSEVKLLNKYQIAIIPNNTKEEYIFPIYLYEIMKNVSWSELDNKKGNKYLRGNVKGENIQAHYLVIGCPLRGYEVDHISRNTKNNMLDNLRIVTKSINNHNKKIYKNNSSGYKGVSYIRKRDRYRATIKIGKEKFDLGYFKLKENAALSYFNIKYNLLGFEFMTDLEIEQYNALLTYFAIKDDELCH